MVRTKSEVCMRTEDTLLIGWNLNTATDTDILIVGRKRENGSVEIIKAFDGDEAEELYLKLVGLGKEKSEHEMP